MLTHNLGYPRIGSQRELKYACESFWAGKTSIHQLQQVGRDIRQANWLLQKNAGIDLVPSNDFSFYDHVLDTSLMLGNIPSRFKPLINDDSDRLEYLYFAMARGYQDSVHDITALEMTKWFDTNYHYMVPEFSRGQGFEFFSTKVIKDFIEAKDQGIITKPVLLGPVSYLLSGKEKEKNFNRIDLLDSILPVYVDVLKILQTIGAQWVQIDEPYLVLDIDDYSKKAYKVAYEKIAREVPGLNIILATYFGEVTHNIGLIASLPVHTLHIDVTRCSNQLSKVIKTISEQTYLSLGVVDGRNIWKNNYEHSLRIVDQALDTRGDYVMIAPSCSMIHVPCDLELETNHANLSLEVKQWMAFAKQKLEEVVHLAKFRTKEIGLYTNDYSNLILNYAEKTSREKSNLAHNLNVKSRLGNVNDDDYSRKCIFTTRKLIQQKLLNLPMYPTTTIGSFPQTREIRTLRAKLKNKQITKDQYDNEIKQEIQDSVRWQEQANLDVLVHGEFERNDMVEYFGEQLGGFAFTSNGWVQSYGSRCVKPPVIYGDVSRPLPMTVEWTTYAQSLTSKPMKGMLTGPVTILQWSFVRDDQPRSVTAMQIALAIRDEVADLERAGIKVIQVDEPAIREGLPLRKADWPGYLDWAVKAFRLAVSVAKPETQIHTHMCYSEFNDIIEAIAAMDADVITIETSRTQMALLDVIAHFKYPNDIGPGVYDIHSPRVPTVEEMISLIEKATKVIPHNQLWVNPDCGLKTRDWDETYAAIQNMVRAANVLRENQIALN